MKFIPILSLSTLTLALIGAGCSKSLETRVSQYQNERKVCIEQRKSTADLTLNGQARTWNSSDENAAEYKCSTVDLAKKYYRQDPEGIVELCVRTNLIGMYTEEKGLGGSLTPETLEQIQTSDSLSDITIDPDGKVTIGNTTLENWRGLCKDVIEGVVERAE